jgi:hypothetical protein
MPTKALKSKQIEKKKGKQKKKQKISCLGSFVQQGDKTREKGDNHESYFLCPVVFSLAQPSPRTSDSNNSSFMS